MSKTSAEKEVVYSRSEPPFVPDAVYNRAVRVLIRLALEEGCNNTGKKGLQRVIKGLEKVAGGSK